MSAKGIVVGVVVLIIYLTFSSCFQECDRLVPFSMWTNRLGPTHVTSMKIQKTLFRKPVLCQEKKKNPSRE